MLDSTEPFVDAIGMPGGSELLLILLIVLVVFGSNRIPQLGDALGKGIKNFRKSFAKDEIEAEPISKEVREVEPREVEVPAVEAQVVKQVIDEAPPAGAPVGVEANKEAKIPG